MTPSSPAFPWIAFHAAVLLLLLVEGLMRWRIKPEARLATYATVLWTGASLLLFGIVWRVWHSGPALEYIAGYAVEEALSVDNLFVFLLLFRLFQVPDGRQGKVLFWGIGGAILLRGLFIAGGLTLLQRFAWINYAFGGLLLVAAVRLLKPEAESAGNDSQVPGWVRWLTRVSPVSPSVDTFFAREKGRLLPTVLLLALVAVELTDVVFALDSIPAVLSITRRPFLAYTSNIMAVMGLRSLYTLLAALLSRLRYLHYGLAGVLGFAGAKILGERWFSVGPLASLGVIAATLAVTIGASMLRARPAGAN